MNTKAILNRKETSMILSTVFFRAKAPTLIVCQIIYSICDRTKMNLQTVEQHLSFIIICNLFVYKKYADIAITRPFRDNDTSLSVIPFFDVLNIEKNSVNAYNNIKDTLEMGHRYFLL